MKRKIMMLLLVGCLLMASAGCGKTGEKGRSDAGGDAEGQEVKTLQLGYAEPETDINHNYFFATHFKESLEELSNGAIKVDIFGNNEIGTEQQLMESMQLGTADMAICINMTVGSFVEETQIFDLPYFYTSYEEALAVADDPKVNEAVKAGCEENGLILLGQGIQGFRHVFNNVRPVNSVSDMEGIKVRIPSSQIYRQTFEALGANPTEITGTEAYTALQQGTVDGIELPYAPCVTQNFFEVNKYGSETFHFFSADDLLMSKQVFDSFTEKEQEWILESGRKAALEQREFVLEMEEDYRQQMKDAGVEINSIDDLKPFSKAVQGIVDEYAEIIGIELVEDAKKIVESMR